MYGSKSSTAHQKLLGNCFIDEVMYGEAADLYELCNKVIAQLSYIQKPYSFYVKHDYDEYDDNYDEYDDGYNDVFYNDGFIEENIVYGKETSKKYSRFNRFGSLSEDDKKFLFMLTDLLVITDIGLSETIFNEDIEFFVRIGHTGYLDNFLSNESASSYGLSLLSEHGDDSMKCKVASHPNTNEDTLNKMLLKENGNDRVYVAMSENPQLSVKFIGKLFEVSKGYSAVVNNVAKNYFTPIQVLEEIFTTSFYAHTSLLANPGCPEHLIKKIYETHADRLDLRLLNSFIHNRQTPEYIFCNIAKNATDVTTLKTLTEEKGGYRSLPTEMYEIILRKKFSEIGFSYHLRNHLLKTLATKNKYSGYPTEWLEEMFPVV